MNTIEIEDIKPVTCNKANHTLDLEIHTSHVLTYNEFFFKYLIGNKPCVIDSKITDDWASRSNFTLNDAPNFEFLRRVFGNAVVPVANCNKEYYNAQMKQSMTINEYIDYWIDYRNTNYSLDKPVLYLKDWHCVKNFPDVPLYEVPSFFASDWLNEYYIAHPTELNDDYMFIYMGPKGSWTPLHVDVLTSYSWSANIIGKKRWLLFPPGEENCLRDSHGHLPYDATSPEFNNRIKYKDYDTESLKKLEIIQDAGQIIFVPSGWHHQVWNLEDTISINHNWINGCNIWNVWLALQKGLLAVMKAVEDCQDMDDWVPHCQLLLKVSDGMDYSQFYDFLLFIARRRLNSLINKSEIISFKKWHLGTNHCLFDLGKIKTVLEHFIEDAKEKSVYSLFQFTDKPEDLLNDINAVL
ncbi:jmjC domain-containing protein 4 [Orussus abietinus]|uniref:jmjC domain-containing protein 4 n=1 Tax=Orussus abietinus TaxID=222816 RepID=UPI0006269C85|nr:jmjC domain-containing protein 4 [Orussus abietinus]